MRQSDSGHRRSVGRVPRRHKTSRKILRRRSSLRMPPQSARKSKMK